MSDPTAPEYLRPYLSAAERYGAGFGSLLWASPKTQAVRFKALLDAIDVTGQTVLDVGCGRADLFDYMVRQRVYPKRDVGFEAVETLAAAAEAKGRPGATIVRGDFVRDPAALAAVGADVVLISGSLNTLAAEEFRPAVRAAFAAAGQVLVFNFLCSTRLSASPHLTWHDPAAVLAFCAAELSADVRMWDAYLPGDATVRVRR